MKLAEAELRRVRRPADRYWRRDLVTEPATRRGGRVQVPAGPGPGVEVDEGFLAKITDSVRTLRRPG